MALPTLIKGTTAIYSLVDPRTNQTRYVGKTVDPSRRFKDHISLATLNRTKTKKNSWIKNLLSENLVPEMRIITIVPSDIEDEAEIAAIEVAKLLGEPLTNGTAGGTGGALSPEIARRAGLKRQGRIQSEEEKARRRESLKPIHASTEFRAKLSAVQKAIGNRPPILCGEDNPTHKFTDAQVREVRERHAIGEKCVDLARWLGASEVTISEWVLGKTRKDVGGPIREKMVRRLTSEQRVEIKNLASQGWKQAEIALRFSVDPSCVSRIVNGRKRSKGEINK